MRGISKRFACRRAEKGNEEALDKATAGFTSSAMGHFNLRFTETDLRRGDRFGRLHATDAMLVTIAVLRCS